MLRDLKFKVKRGEFVGILGDIGSGKSSFISMMIGDLLHIEHDFSKMFHEIVESE